MVEIISWTKRQFTFDQPVGVFPAILERLRGTPARAAAIVAKFTEESLAAQIDQTWSAKEHIGHLVDLQPLDDARLQQFLNRVPVLSQADMENKATQEANHRETPVAQILERLRIGRDELVQKLEMLTPGELAIPSLHPRLKQTMRLMDWVLFVAEHDDHHLVKARLALSSFYLP